MKPLAILVTVLTTSFASAQFISGNLAVYRVGMGSGSLNNAATATFVDQFNTTSTGQSAINSVIVDTIGANRLTNSGNATSEGAIIRSQNGLVLSFGGYDAAIGTATVATTSTSGATPVARVAGLVDGAGAYTRVASFGTGVGAPFDGNNIRGTVHDAGRTWAVGSNSGVVSNVGGTVSTVSTTNANNRVVNVFSDQLYFSAGAGLRGIWAVGAGTPTSGSVTSQRVINTGVTSSPYAFQANTTGDVVYVADDRTIATGGGIQKWIWDGTDWSLATSYTLGTGTGSTVGARGLTVDWSNPNAPIIYETTAEGSANRLIRIVDTGASSTATTLATAGTNTIYRGVDQTLLPATWKGSSNGDFVNTNTSTTGFSNAFSNWSVGLADGINLAFQKVNAATVTANNNSTLTSVSSIKFTGAGFGSSDTAYTLSGNAFTLNGTAATGSGVTNNSTALQTINMDLTLATPQTFNAASGALAFGGAVSLGANALTVTGASNTTISGNLSGSGPLTKTGAGTLILSGSNGGYSGPVGVGNGTLQISGTNATGTGATTVGGTGRLQGSATLAEVIVNSGGTVAPGASPGTLNSGLATWNGGGAFEFEINDANGMFGTNWDLWNVTNNNGLTINATAGDQFIINIPDPQTITNFNPMDPYSWQFLTFNGAIQGAGFDPNAFNVVFGGPFAGNGTFSVSQVGNGLVLNFSPVPEPSSMLLIAAVAGAFFLRRRLRAN